MASTTMNYDAQFDNVDYKDLRKVGHNATISQFKDKVKLVNDEECQIKILRGTTIEENNQGVNAKDLLYKLGEQAVFFSFTMREYETMLKSTSGTIKEIPGDVRASKGWQQTIGMPTVMDSANQLMWHMSKGHTDLEDNLVVMGVNLDQYNLMSHLATKKVNCFQRGYTMQMFQVLHGHNYKLTDNELKQVVVLCYKDYNVLQLAQRFTWAAGFVWAYSMPVNVKTAVEAIEADNDNPIATAMIQGLHNGGNNAFRALPKDIRDKALGFYLDNGITIEASNLLPEQSLGHHDHVMWIMEKNNSPKKEGDKDDEEQDDDEDKNDNDNDGNQGMGKKRKMT